MKKNEPRSLHGEWSSRWMFILAASSAAVGLGNIWKFPYIAGMNGGGAFVLIYLVCVLIVGIPLLMAETLLGRHGRRNPMIALKNIAKESGRSRQWKWLGALIILSGFLILTYYSVITGWTVHYVFVAASGAFHQASAEHVNQIYDHFIANPWKVAAFHTVTMITTIYIVARGIEKGLETAVRFMFPVLVCLLFLLIGYAMESHHFAQALSFLFKPDFSKLSRASAVIALGHSFFTLSLATGTIMMYGAYVPKNTSITAASVFVAMTDTVIALLAGMAIFPVVFANGLAPDTGPALIFKTLPIAFGHMPFGSFFATLFFIMLVFAALTSAISLLEPTVAWMIETFHMRRGRAAMLAGFIIWFLGFGTIFSFSYWEHIRLFGKTFFENLDFLTANLMLPICGFLTTIFCGWMVSRSIINEELKVSGRRIIRAWRVCIRYLAPFAIMVIFLSVFQVI